MCEHSSTAFGCLVRERLCVLTLAMPPAELAWAHVDNFCASVEHLGCDRLVVNCGEWKSCDSVVLVIFYRLWKWAKTNKVQFHLYNLTDYGMEVLKITESYDIMDHICGSLEEALSG